MLKLERIKKEKPRDNYSSLKRKLPPEAKKADLDRVMKETKIKLFQKFWQRQKLRKTSQEPPESEEETSK